MEIFVNKLLGKLFLLIAALFICSGLMAGNILIRGKVIDEKGDPVIGASLLVQGSTIGTIADEKGQFELQAPVNSQLQVQCVGFINRTVKVGPDTQFLKMVLQSNTHLLQEAVVVGYGSVKKDDLTGSVVAIKAETLNKGAVTGPQELIQGKMSGVFVTPGDGAPGSGSTIRIRSGASLNASNDPLIVIDGMPISNDAAPGMANPLSSINPNDIASFTVLKDASATAIYGSRASNGVIIITTKRGKGHVKVSYNSTYSVNTPYKRVNVLNASQYRNTMSGYFGNNKDVMGMLNMFPNQSTDWQNEIYQNAFGTDQNISIGGSTAHMPYRVSLGYNHTDGIMKTAKYERYTLDVNLNPKFFHDDLSVMINLKNVINNNVFANSDAVGSAAFYDPTKPVHSGQPLYNGYWNWANGDVPAELALSNPLELLLDHQDSGNTKRSFGNIQFDYRLHFLPDLHLNLNLGYDVAQGNGTKGFNVGSFDAMKDDNFKGVGQMQHWQNTRRSQLLEYYMNYQKDLKSIKSHLDVMGGYSWQHFYYSNYTKFYSPYNDQYPVSKVPEGWDRDDANGEFLKQGCYKIPGEYYLISFYGRLNYSFDKRYLLTATLRRDGSSKFAKNHQWGLFPSVALAWNIKNEAFMKHVNALSTFKLRLGFGETGQQDVADYQYIDNYISGSNPNSTYMNEYLMEPGKYNPDLKWETTDTYNVGLDYGFLHDRISGSIEVYKKKTRDLLSIINIPAGTNFSNKLFSNIGNMENKGVEFNINAVPVQTKDFTWNAGFNVTWNNSKITKLAQKESADFTGTEAGNEIQRHMEGYSPYSFFVFQQVYDKNGKPLQNVFVDRNHDGKITNADRYFAHDPMPKVYLGFNSEFKYKDFDLGFNLRADLGNYVYDNIAAQHSSLRNAYDGIGFMNNLFHGIYDTGFNLPNSPEQRLSDLFLENASFLRMDNLTLGYTFKRFFTEKLKGRIAFSVQNVFVVTKYKGVDPETSGFDDSMRPRPRVFTLALNLDF